MGRPFRKLSLLVSSTLPLLSFAASGDNPSAAGDTYPGAVVSCKSLQSPDEVDGADSRSYGITVFDKKGRSSWLAQSDMDASVRQQKVNDLVLDILHQAGISEINGDYDLQCDPPVFSDIKEEAEGHKTMTLHQYNHTRIFYYLSFTDGDQKVQYLDRVKQIPDSPLGQVPDKSSGAASAMLNWTTNAKLTMLAASGVALLTIFGTTIITVIPGGVLTAVAAIYGGALLAYRSPELRRVSTKSVQSLGLYLVAKFDTVMSLLSGVPLKKD